MDTGAHATDATWDVVVTVKAARDYVSEFIDVYRNLGASRIHIFYDDPLQSYSFEGADLSETICDVAHWKEGRPRAIEKRQMANATSAASASTSDWIIHSDIDEHVYSARPISEILAALPEDCGCYTVLPVEAIFPRRPETVSDIFATSYFKSIQPGWKTTHSFWSEVFGSLSTLSLAGFWGHRIGKSFIRVKALPDINTMPIHMPMGAMLAKVHPIRSREVVLRHYDALLPGDWVTKHTDRVKKHVRAVWAGERRDAQSKLVSDTFDQSGMEGALDLYDRMFVVGPETLARGLKIGAVKVLARENLSRPHSGQHGPEGAVNPGKSSSKAAD